MAEVARIHRQYRSRKTTPLDVVRAHIRVALDEGVQLNAFTSILQDTAIEEAALATRRFAKGQPLSVLDGIPLTVKDLLHIRGVPTTASSRASDPRPQPEDADIVRRLRAAGAIIIGKTNLLEYAYGLVHPEFGAVGNPRGRGHTVGGSSSGSAAAVAIGAGVASIGTDTAGSVRNPAALAGVVGFKPAYGVLPMGGTIALSPSLDHLGILAGSVADTRAVYEACAGVRVGRGPARPRIGIVHMPDLHPDVESAFLGMVESLRHAGCDGVDVREFPFSDANAAALAMLYAEAAEVHMDGLARRWPGYSPGTAARIVAGLSIRAVDYVRALAVRCNVAAEYGALLRRCDVLVLPTLPAPAPLEDGGGGDRSLSSAPLHTSVFNLLGVPALTVPIGRSRKSGMPIGLQIAGPAGGDAKVFAAARLVERLRGQWQ